MTERRTEVHETHVHDGHHGPRGPYNFGPVVIAIVAILAVLVAVVIALSVAGPRGGGDAEIDLPRPGEVEPGGGGSE